MIIYLMQHGLSNPKEKDSEEGLSAEGEKAVCFSANALKQLDIHPELIVMSSKKRSIQTAEIIANALQIDPSKWVETENAKATMDPSETLKEIENYTASEVFICGHLPSIHEIASFLLGNADIEMQNASCICIETSHLFSKNGKLKWALTADQLKRIA